MKRIRIPKTWTPTADNINALPGPLRDFIMGLETRCDPAGLVRENAILKDSLVSLENELAVLSGFTDHEVRANTEAIRAAVWARIDRAMGRQYRPRGRDALIVVVYAIALTIPWLYGLGRFAWGLITGRW